MNENVTLKDQRTDYLLRAVDPYAQSKYDIILENVTDLSNKDVLFVGVGSGELACQFASKGARIDAFDIDEQAITLTRNYAREAGLEMNLWTSSIEEVSANKKYDLIVATDVIEHIQNDKAAVQKMNSLLKGDGTIVITVPALQSLFGYHDEVLGHFRRYSKEQLVRLLKESSAQAQFKLVRYYGFSLIPVSFLISRVLRRPYPVAQIGSQSKQQSGVIGKLAHTVFTLEKKISPPLGTSLIAIYSLSGRD